MKSTMQESKLSIPAILRHGLLLFPESKVLTYDGAHATEVTFAQVGARAAQLANALAGLGIRRDDRVGTFCFNHNQHLEAYLAIPSMGAVLHTLNVRLFSDQLEFVINDAQDKVIIADAVVLPLLVKVLDACPSVETVLVVGEYDASGYTGGHYVLSSYEDAIAAYPESYDWVEPESETDAAAMCYTSGTTGNPKGVVYSHRSTWLHSQAVTSSAALGLSTEDRSLIVVPMFHANAWGIPYAAWMVGADMIMPGRFLQAEPLAWMFTNLAPTMSSGVPVIWNDLLHYAENHHVDFSSVRLICGGGSAVPRGLIEGFRKEFSLPIIQGWGMTETSPVCTLAIPPVGTPVEKEIEYMVTAGRPLAGVELRIVDADGNVAANDGESLGEIEVSGPWITGSYYKNQRPEAFDDGWLRTGDMGTLDPEGYLRIVDRTKDVIKSGGEWISSVELENVLMAHPLVFEAAVVGVPDAKWDERPLACIVVKPGETLTAEELSAFLLDKVARWWLPERWSFVAEIPKTSVGKFDKKVLRGLYAEEKLEVTRL